jgi:hypothetical protein
MRHRIKDLSHNKNEVDNKLKNIIFALHLRVKMKHLWFSNQFYKD